MSKVPDQKKMWDDKHANDEHGHFRDKPSEFAKISEGYFSHGAELLELGCGNGRDSLFFANQGYKVVATDFSETVLEQNKKIMPHENITYSLLDISQRFKFSNSSFDVVFANLSIHYFDDAKTKEIVAEICRVLKPNGIFAFACKADDSYRKQGAKEIEQDYYIGATGHAMHFISEAYAKELVAADFEVLKLDQVGEFYVNRTNSITRCICRKLA